MNHTQSSSGSKTRQQIALEFDFSYLTLWRRLKDYEIDPPKEYHALIWHYRIIRYLENTLPPSLKKAYFPIWAEYWRKFLKDTDFFPVK